MSVLLVTKWKGKRLACLTDDRNLIEAAFAGPEDAVAAGDIIVGKAANVVHNIDAVFIQLAPGVTGFLPYAEIPQAIFTRRSNPEQVTSGDELLV